MAGDEAAAAGEGRELRPWLVPVAGAAPASGAAAAGAGGRVAAGAGLLALVLAAGYALTLVTGPGRDADDANVAGAIAQSLAQNAGQGEPAAGPARSRPSQRRSVSAEPRPAPRHPQAWNSASSRPVQASPTHTDRPRPPAPATPASASAPAPQGRHHAVHPAARPAPPPAVPAVRHAHRRVGTPSPAAAPASPPAPGGVVIQIGAFSTQARAQAAWRACASGKGAARLGHSIEPVRVGGRTLYRLRVRFAAQAPAVRVHRRR